jgi:arylsulfatase A-like enzyme
MSGSLYHFINWQMIKKPLLTVPFFISLELLVQMLSFTACTSGKPQQQHPNIVLIVADDLGYGDFSCYGATKIATPTIDQLAADGVRFTDAYAPSSLCSPSRYSLMTGRYSWRTRLKTGVLSFFAKPLIGKGRTTLASLLKRSGYYTVCIGKWHLGFNWALKDDAPADPDKNVFNSWSVQSQRYIDFSKPVRNGPTTRGFDYFFGIAGSLNMLPFVFIRNESVVQVPRDFNKAVHRNTQYSLEAPDWNPAIINRVLTGKAVQAIDDHFTKNPGRPFFLYFPTSAIHQSCLPTFTKGKSRAGLRGDMVEEFDWSVKEVVKALKENKAFENTLLIITSDNGPRPGDPVRTIERYKHQDTGRLKGYYLNYFSRYKPRYKDPYGNKMWQAGWLTYGHRAAGDLLGFKTDAWEGGLRVPLIAEWPGEIKPGRVDHHMICNTDLMSTFACVVKDHLEKNEGEDSYSFYEDLLDDRAPQRRKSMVLTSGGSGAFVVRDSAWKYIEASQPTRWVQTYYPDGPWIKQFQLYDIEKDPGERNNLYHTMPRKAAALKRIIERVRHHPGSEGK